MADPIPKDPYERHIIFRQEFGTAALGVASLANVVAQYRLAASCYEQGPLHGVFSQAPQWTTRFYDPRYRVGRFLRQTLGGGSLREPSLDFPARLNQSAMKFATATSLGYLFSQGLRFYGNLGSLKTNLFEDRPSASGLETMILAGDSVALVFAFAKSINFLLGAGKATRAVSLESILRFQKAQSFVAVSSLLYAATAVFKLIREYSRPQESSTETPMQSTVIYSTMDMVNGVSGAFGAWYFRSLSRRFLESGKMIEAQNAALGFSKWSKTATLSGGVVPFLTGFCTLGISAAHYFFLDGTEDEKRSSRIGFGIGILNIFAATFAFPSTGFLSALLMVPSLGLGIWQTKVDYRKSKRDL